MRKVLIPLVLIIGCGGSKQEAAAPAPAPTVAPAPAPAPAPTEAAPAPAPAPVAAATPTIVKAIMFGSDKDKNAIKGTVYQMPPTQKELPTFGASLTPVGILYTDKWDIKGKFTEGFPGANDKLNEFFAIRWEGKFTAKTATTYEFKIKSKDAARLSIDGQMVVNNDGVHPAKEEKGSSLLNAGEHAFVIEYFQSKGPDVNLQIWVTPSKGQPKILTPTF